jgi:hypothetical protein
VADPFMVREGGTWYMFFEVLDAESYRGKISLATSETGTEWTYRQVVLDEPFHLSYPHVVRWNDNYYMVPESYSANSVRLYKAVEFPLRWIHVADLLPGALVDASLFEHAGQWWMFAADQKGNNRLRLFRADTLLGPWSEHPASPVVQDDARIARPGGRVVTHAGHIYRYTQDCVENYGVAVRVFEITRLDALHYEEREAAPAPLVQASGAGWNRDGMHHIDAHHVGDDHWMACVDGNRMKITFRLSW